MKRIKCLIKTILPVLLTFSVLALAACTNAIDSGSSNDEKKKPSKPEEELLPYTVVDTVEINEKAYEIVTFGSWPQALIEDGVQITEETKDAGYFTSYYKGDDGEWYAELNGSYFKVMPIRWRILTNDYNGNKLLFAENSLIHCKYYDAASGTRTINEKSIPAINYEHSRVRAFLNGLVYNSEGASNDEFDNKGFFQTAFTTEEQTFILKTRVDNSEASADPTNDSCFLLSYPETTLSDYGFNADKSIEDENRIRKPTDYAVASGVVPHEDTKKGCSWLLRSPGSRAGRVYTGNAAGGLGNGLSVASATSGVVPAICIKNQ